MSAKRENAAIVGVGAAACAACCAGPILGVLAAIGLGTAAGFALFGAAALLIGALAVGVVRGRRRRVATGNAAVPAHVPVELSSTPASSMLGHVGKAEAVNGPAFERAGAAGVNRSVGSGGDRRG